MMKSVTALMTYMVKAVANPAIDLAPFGRWTLRDEAAQRRSSPRWASQGVRAAAEEPTYRPMCQESVMFVKKHPSSALASLLTKMSQPGHSDRESEIYLMTFCLNCPDPFGALNVVLDAPKGTTDEEIAKQALSMASRCIESVAANELPSSHPLRSWQFEE